MAEKHYRSLVKGVSWRITGSIDTMIISFLVTGKLKFALAITSVEFFTKIFLYYLHERVVEGPFWPCQRTPAGQTEFYDLKGCPVLRA